MLPIEIGLHSTEKVLDLKGIDVDTGKSQKNPFTRELYYPLLLLPLLHVQTREISQVGYELSQLSTFILMAEIRSFQGNLKNSMDIFQKIWQWRDARCRNSRCCMLLLKKDFMSYAKNSWVLRSYEAGELQKFNFVSLRKQPFFVEFFFVNSRIWCCNRAGFFLNIMLVSW